MEASFTLPAAPPKPPEPPKPPTPRKRLTEAARAYADAIKAAAAAEEQFKSTEARLRKAAVAAQTPRVQRSPAAEYPGPF